ncbi:MAG: hypothetical protein QXO95_00905 [Candidatus Aenigmatarchaeota archaeon]
MSIRSTFYEELVRYGIDPLEVVKIEFKKSRKGTKVVVHTTNKPINISDPYFVTLAKATALQVQLEKLFSRDYLLKRLYGIITVFEGKEMPFSEFLLLNAKVSTEEIAKRLEELERKYSVDKHLKDYKEGLKIRIYKKLALTCGISFRDFEKDNEDSTTENLIDVLAHYYYQST